MPDPSGPRAGFWRRFAAVVVDALVLAVVWIPLIVIGRLAHVPGLVAVIIPVGIAYEIYFHGSASGQTPGKRALGIRVIDFGTGGPIGYGHATIRLIGRYVSAIPCYLGYFWMLWDGEKQCWHDKLASDVVVPEAAYPVSR